MFIIPSSADIFQTASLMLNAREAAQEAGRPGSPMVFSLMTK
jgi:hypothetical protein